MFKNIDTRFPPQQDKPRDFFLIWGLQFFKVLQIINQISLQ